MSIDELMQLSRIRLIGDGASGWIHVARERGGVVSLRLLDLHRTIAMNDVSIGRFKSLPL